MNVRERGAAEALARNQALVEALRPTSNDEESCLAWMTLQRQVRTYLRHIEPRVSSLSAKGCLPPYLQAAEADLIRSGDEATEQLRRFDSVRRSRAEARMGLRLAVIGKGGAGKTFVVSTLARLLARHGRAVLAIDMDTNPGLSMSLGLPPIDAGLPLEAVEENAGSMYGWRLAPGLSPAEAVRRYSVEAPDGVRFLGVGKIGTVDKANTKRSIGALLSIALGFASPDWDVIADLEAGPTTPFERYHSFADDVALVVGPAWRSAMTVRRLLPMVGARRTMVVANQFRDEPDHPGLEPVARIPFDHDVRLAEGAGLAPLDACPDARAIELVHEFAHRCLIPESVSMKEAVL